MSVGSDGLTSTGSFGVVVSGRGTPSVGAVQAVRHAYAAIKGIEDGSWNAAREQKLASEIEELFFAPARGGQDG